jgi:hypothetical protein
MTKVKLKQFDRSGAINGEYVTYNSATGLWEPGAGPTAAPTKGDKDLNPLATAAANYQTTGITLTLPPAGDKYVTVYVNGHTYDIGDGVRTKDCYFSRDGGTTALALSALAAGDILYWNSIIAGFTLDITDNVDLDYDVPAGGGSGGGGWVDDGTVVRLETTSDDVGIGTASPGAKLEVVGDAIIDGKLTVTGLIDPIGLILEDTVSGDGAYLALYDGQSVSAPGIGDGYAIIRYNDSSGKAEIAGPGDSWVEVGGGGTDLTGLGVDNTLVRWDGTDTVKSSGITVDNSDNMSGLTSLSLGTAVPGDNGIINLPNNCKIRGRDTGGTPRDLFEWNNLDDLYIGNTGVDNIVIRAGSEWYLAAGGTTHALSQGGTAMKLEVFNRLKQQAAQPGGVAGYGQVYTYSAGGRTELFYTDSSGSHTQLTSQGAGVVRGSGVDNYVMRWNGTGAAQGSQVHLADTGAMSGVASLSLDDDVGAATSSVGEVIIINNNGVLEVSQDGYEYAPLGYVNTGSPKTGNYNAGIGDLVKVDPSGGGFAITLPTASGYDNQGITIKNVTNSTNAVTFNTTSGQTIDGMASGVDQIDTAYETVTFISDGTNWMRFPPA